MARLLSIPPPISNIISRRVIPTGNQLRNICKRFYVIYYGGFFPKTFNGRIRGSRMRRTSFTFYRSYERRFLPAHKRTGAESYLEFKIKNTAQYIITE